jgi:predicted transcriptional regulator
MWTWDPCPVLYMVVEELNGFKEAKVHRVLRVRLHRRRKILRRGVPGVQYRVFEITIATKPLCSHQEAAHVRLSTPSLFVQPSFNRIWSIARILSTYSCSALFIPRLYPISISFSRDVALTSLDGPCAPISRPTMFLLIRDNSLYVCDVLPMP